MRKKNKKIKFLVIIYIIVAGSMYIYHKCYVPDNLNIEIRAIADSGDVTFRGMFIDEKWYNPKDVITNNSNWIEDETGTLYTAVDESTLYLKVPKGKSYYITFNAGPEQGMVQIEANDEKIELDLWVDNDVEQGLSFEIPMLSDDEKVNK